MRAVAPSQTRTEPLAVTIDLWFTLIAFSRAGPKRYERARRSAWVEPLVELGLPPHVAERSVRAMEEWANEREGTGHSVSLAEQADELDRMMHIRPNPHRVGHSIAFALASANLTWKSGIHRTLGRLRRRGLKLAVVSNILFEPPETARGLLRRLGPAGFFDAIVLSADGPDAKPSPGMLRRAARELHVPTARILHVGDSPADLLAAARAGVAFVRYTGRPHSPAPPLPLPSPRVRYPSIRQWGELADDFDRIWRTASAARERALTRGRSGRAPRRPRPRGRASAPRSRRPSAPRSPPRRIRGRPRPRG
ncbi:MAG: HAD-IA family hydrolase [Thermoplasmata archaeon]|nr:HAD-IA family hydrolase [Thermoplasmata archaeon]MCI4362011.1 HAD-IA family hydrolase [Thermoplasmata archaeon]